MVTDLIWIKLINYQLLSKLETQLNLDFLQKISYLNLLGEF